MRYDLNASDFLGPQQRFRVHEFHHFPPSQTPKRSMLTPSQLILPTAVFTMVMLCIALYAIYEASVLWSMLQGYDLYAPVSSEPGAPWSPRIEARPFARVEISRLNESTVVRRPGPLPVCVSIQCVGDISTCRKLDGVQCRIGRSEFQEKVTMMTRWTARYVREDLNGDVEESVGFNVPPEAFEVFAETDECVTTNPESGVPDASGCAETMGRFRTMRHLYTYRGGESLAQMMLYTGEERETKRNAIFFTAVSVSTVLYFFAVIHVIWRSRSRTYAPLPLHPE